MRVLFSFLIDLAMTQWLVGQMWRCSSLEMASSYSGTAVTVSYSLASEVNSEWCR